MTVGPIGFGVGVGQRGQRAKLKGDGGHVEDSLGGYNYGEFLCIRPHRKWVLTIVNLF
jgi:hypothetical protein